MVKCAFHVFNRRFNFGRAKIIIIIIVIIIISQENVQSKRFKLRAYFETRWACARLIVIRHASLLGGR